MLTIKPGEHGSTYGGNPLACKVAMAALRVLKDEGLAANAEAMGQRVRTGLADVASRRPLVALARGRGLLNAVVVDDTNDKNVAMAVCMRMMERGLLAKPTHGNIIRLAPPLVISAAQVDESLAIFEDALATVDAAK